MHCGSTWRPPRRTAFAGRLGLIFCLLALAFGVPAGPAAAYSCGAASQARTLAGHAAEKRDCDQRSAGTTRRKNADPMSFVFFTGVLIAVALVPTALGRREERSAE